MTLDNICLAKVKRNKHRSSEQEEVEYIYIKFKMSTEMRTTQRMDRDSEIVRWKEKIERDWCERMIEETRK